MTRAWEEGICNETSGFLFRHACTQLAQHHCADCGKPICEEHSIHIDGRILCPPCERKDARRKGRNTSDTTYHDTYYHSGSYYSGYGYHVHSHGSSTHVHGQGGVGADPDDFQAGDAENLRAEGDEDFETDMADS